MGRTPLERISQREYAKRLGISNNAVSKAVADGRIKKGWDVKQGKIIVDLANREFGALHAKVAVPDEGQEEDIQEEEGAASSVPKDEFKLTARSSYMQAKTYREIMLARQAEIEYNKLMGVLVRVEDVNSELYKFGQELRLNLMAIPDKIAGKVMACKNQAEIKLVVSGAIHSVLESLTTAELNFEERK